MPQEEANDQEAQELESKLQKLAERWRKRLEDPVLQAQIKAGKMQLNPLVDQLLDAFPPASKR